MAKSASAILKNKQSFSANKQSFSANKAVLPTSMADLLASGNLAIPTLKRGQEVRGKVVMVTPSEILVDIGAKSEGVIAGRELDLSRDVVSKIKLGQPIEATVVFPENDVGQVVLSLRRMAGEALWRQLEEKKAAGQEIEVDAVEVNRGGIICDFAGIRGFLPASQLGQVWSALSDLVGTRLRVGVIEVDKATNRLIFSQKKPGVKDGDLAKLLKKIAIGDRYGGTVTAILPFGVFVEIDIGSGSQLSVLGSQLSGSGQPVSQSISSKTDKQKTGKPTSVFRQKTGPNRQQKTDNKAKLEGLVHISEISWEKVEDPTSLFKVGDKVEVMVIAKDEKNGRVNLSIKQLIRDPFGEISAKFFQSQKVGGTVARVTPYGVFVQLPEGIEGLMHISKIPPNVTYRVGEEVECEIETIDVPARKISLVPIVKEKPILYR